MRGQFVDHVGQSLLQRIDEILLADTGLLGQIADGLLAESRIDLGWLNRLIGAFANPRIDGLALSGFLEF